MLASAFRIEQFADFFDDAALFPPGDAPMTRAVPEHRARLAAPTGGAVGPFIIAANRLGELSAVLDSQADPGGLIEIGIVVPGGAAGIGPALTMAAADHRLAVRSIEVAITIATDPVREFEETITTLTELLPPDALGYIETGYAPTVLSQLQQLNGTGHRLKFRCGGLTAELFPSTAELAAGIAAAVRAGVAFKGTAGLHHAIRHTAPGTGFEHFGFLNILLAAGEADTTDTHGLQALLDERDPTVVADRIRALGATGLATARRRFRSYGTCDIAEPLTDLTNLDLLASPAGDEDHLPLLSTTERSIP
jgi:hypothetical protein